MEKRGKLVEIQKRVGFEERLYIINRVTEKQQKPF